MPLYRSSVVNSTYVPGTTEITYGFLHNIYADIQTAENKLNFELYGARVSNMKNYLYCPAGTDVTEGDKLVVNSLDYTVISVTSYMTHVVVVAEKAVQNERSG